MPATWRRRNIVPASAGNVSGDHAAVHALADLGDFDCRSTYFFPGAQSGTDSGAPADGSGKDFLRRYDMSAEQKSKSLSGTRRSFGGRCGRFVVKLDPRTMMKNPVMFVVEVGSVVTTLLLLMQRTCRLSHSTSRSRCGYGSRCCSPISPKPWRKDAEKRKLTRCAKRGPKPSPSACCADGTHRRGRQFEAARRVIVVMVAAGEFIPGDGEVIEGVASVDESAITGESAPVIRESGGDRSAVTGGTRVLSDRDQSSHHVQPWRNLS